MQISPIITELVASAQQSVENMRNSIKNVSHAGFNEEMTAEKIEFEISGDQIKPEFHGKYVGELKGRNRDLCVGHNETADRAIALRVLLDGNAVKI